jgi:predicted nucleic acid-binding protein
MGSNRVISRPTSRAPLRFLLNGTARRPILPATRLKEAVPEVRQGSRSIDKVVSPWEGRPSRSASLPIIPPGVAAELGSPKRPEAVRAFIAAPPHWLEILSPSSVESIAGLHVGEAAAISLAREIQATRLLIDKSRGRKAAAERSLQVIGTIGVLEAAAEMGLIELEQAFEKVKQTDFWLAPTFLDERLARFREREQVRAEAAGRGAPART